MRSFGPAACGERRPWIVDDCEQLDAESAKRKRSVVARGNFLALHEPHSSALATSV